ncbi:aminotransferase, putative [Talaromyces marneffei ATCC 18224]|uniref:Aminotransferase, putative n=1 Tax=Talaromyces marneffei (strain ATCC 18224 / CBS 334.59 / QM 7333) TaxID=441960 RepID=B6QH71_TALMQ|nr:aminotransferase, putative [Talaromyces marneffei ATCC 18224]
MAQTNSQIPQHVSALLSHLTSRPGVQSTLILSRKDGSIIQSTGLLAATSPSSLGTSNTTNNTDNNLENSSPPRGTVTNSSTTDLASPTLPSPESVVSGQPSANSTQNNQQPYKPSQAETLAAHIFAFMTSASGLALSLSGSGSTGNDDVGYDSRSKGINGTLENGTTTDVTTTTTDRTHEREEDDEIKLLRLRTKKNEIVVVPDRKYLLCVVHDAAGAGATSSSGGGTARTSTHKTQSRLHKLRPPPLATIDSERLHRRRGEDPDRLKAVWSAIAQHEEYLQEILLKFLRDKAEKGLVTIYGEPQSSKDLRVPVISFTVKDMPSRRVVEEVEKISKLGFRNGHMYSHRLLKDVFGLEDMEDGVVRISMLHYSTGKKTTVI